MTSHIQYVESRSPRSVWVEIICFRPKFNYLNVTLPTERVSWNGKRLHMYHIHIVTLPTERVSWNADTAHGTHLYFKSRSPRSVWVEIKNNLEQYLFLTCHAPHGACELKYCLSVVKYYYVLCHAPHGACELKLYFLKSIYIFPCHAPHGACELKCYANSKRDLRVLVTLPTERVSWNNNSIAIYMQKPGHAPHGACEWGRRGAILYKIVITENRG